MPRRFIYLMSTPKRTTSILEACIRWFATVIAVLVFAYTALGDAVYIRLRQNARPLAGGRIEWYEYAVHGASSYEWTSLPMPVPAPAPRPVVEWVGVSGKAPPPQLGVSSMRIVSSGFPLPFVASLPAIFLWILYYKRRNAAMVGLCASCGYSREGLQQGTVCPECGAAPSAQ